MKNLFLLLMFLSLLSCNQKNEKIASLQKKIDSLELQLKNTYKPGFGEIMSVVQAHHSKLYFAGIYKNWKLADFEVHEIMEAVENIKKYETERKESEYINMIEPYLDSVNVSIQKKNEANFKTNFIELTNRCNTCHKDTHFEFNVVKIPETSPFTNQVFEVKK